MIKNRIIYVIYLIAAVLLYILANGKATFAILVTAALMPVMSVALAVISARNVNADIKTEPDPDSRSSSVILTLSNPGILPVALAEAGVNYTNLRTGETGSLPVRMPLPPRGNQSLSLELPEIHAGLYRLSVTGIVIYDVLRLVGLKRKAEGIAEFLSSPKVFHIDIDTIGAAAAMLEGDMYSDRRSGNDPGEVRAIHEYVPGDPVKNIHWKLSEKTDKLLVKELGLPVTDQVLVLMDTFYNEDEPSECADTLASVFASLLESLLDENIDYSAGWLDPDSGKIHTEKLSDETGLADAAWHYLAVPPADSGICDHIVSNDIGSRFAHLVIAGKEFSSIAQLIAASCRVTMLLYGQSGTGTAQGGLSVIGFESEDYREKLSAIEI